VPDGSRDLPVEKAILLENGFDELNAIDWEKGCYMGQELTARTRYRGLVRKRLLPVAIEGQAPAPGAALLQNDKEMGEMRSAAGDLGLALIRLEALGQGPLTAAGATLTPRKPDWVRLQE
jgi:folate-binding protein YgfZ